MLDIGGSVPLNNHLLIVSIKIFLSFKNIVTHNGNNFFYFVFDYIKADGEEDKESN